MDNAFSKRASPRCLLCWIADSKPPAQRNLLQRRRSDLSLLESRLHASSPLPTLQQMQRETLRMRHRLVTAMQHQLQQAGDRLGHLTRMLDSLSPLATLQRGYAIVTDAEGRVITDAGAVTTGEQVSARLAKGRLGLTVDEVE